MPFYEVHKGQDAYVSYATAVEAGSPEQAREIAGSRDYGGTWHPIGDVEEFDAIEIYEESGELIDAETFEEAVKQIHDAYDFVDLQLKPRQRDLVLGSLRDYRNGFIDPVAAEITKLIEEIERA